MKTPKYYAGFCNDKTIDKKCRNKFRQQLKRRGFDDSELWNLDVTICEFLTPRLKEFIKQACKIHAYSKKEKKELKRLLKLCKEYKDDVTFRKVEFTNLLSKWFDRLWL